MAIIQKFLNLDYFVSELDAFLIAFDKANPKLSASQQKEKEKFARIYKLRDDPDQSETPITKWDQF